MKVAREALTGNGNQTKSLFYAEQEMERNGEDPNTFYT
jgi:hypothetical protein